jgi:hypothetical protein
MAIGRDWLFAQTGDPLSSGFLKVSTYLPSSVNDVKAVLVSGK